MLVQACQTLERGFNVLRWDVSNLLSFKNAYEPPITIAVVHQDQTVPLDNAGLTLNRCGKAMERIDQIEVNRLVWNREGWRAVVLSILLLAVIFGVFLNHRVLLFVRMVLLSLTKMRFVVRDNLLAQVKGILACGTSGHYRSCLIAMRPGVTAEVMEGWGRMDPSMLMAHSLLVILERTTILSNGGQSKARRYAP